MRVVPKPDRSTPLLNADGKTISDAWDQYFAYLSSLNLPAFAKTAPANGQVPIFDATTGVYSPGAN